MKIAIIGAGLTGLSAAYELVKKGHQVTVFEKDPNPGGLAIGYKEKEWSWSLEKHHHHWFTNDDSILNLAKDINYEVIIKRPKTSVFVRNKIYQFDSPITVLKFPLLSIVERLRMSLVIGFLKYDPFWKPLEKFKASTALPILMGKKSYEMIWEPLFINKFGEFANNVSFAWFWARIKKRTPSLVYPKKGFFDFANELVEQIEKKGGKIYFDTEILELTNNKNSSVIFKDENKIIKTKLFEKIIVTIPSALFLKIAPGLPKEYKDSLRKLKSLGVTSLIVRLKKPFFNDGTYWLNICDSNAPMMVIVEHTNFMDIKNYNYEHIIYLGSYNLPDDEYFNINKEQMLKKFDKYLRKINPEYYKNIINFEFFKAPFAQPIIPINYSKILPSFKTPFKNVYLANIEQIYPWDRGTNYAVELGKKVSKIMINEKN